MPPPACTSGTPFNILSGPCDVYVAPVGTAFTVVNVAPSGSWTALGRTEGGIMVRHTQKVELLSTDQTIGNIKAIRSEEGMEIELSLAEIDIAKMAKVLNDATVTTVTGPPHEQSFQPHRGRCVTRFALQCRGDSPYGAFSMQFDVPVVVQTADPELKWVNNDKVVLHTIWTALEDLTAGTEAARFGSIHAQDS